MYQPSRLCAGLARRLGVLVIGAAAALVANAQYPERPIKLLVPFPSGSGTDVVARVIGNELGLLARQPIVIENKAGANGFIATEQAARAQPDGYTLLITSNSHIANKFLFKKLPYDPTGDFKGIALYKKPTPLVLVVAANSPYKTLADVTAAIKKAPGKLSYASGNSSSRVGAELYKQLIDGDMLYVPFKGNPEGLTQVLAGQVTMMFSDVGACIPLVKAGRLRAIAITGPDRLESMPTVPTAPEAGLPALDIGSWGMFLAPKGTPDAVVEKLNAWINEAVKRPAVIANFKMNDGVPFSGTRLDLDRFVAAETEKWGGVVKRAGIEPE